MTSTPRKILPTYIQTNTNSNIKLYQAKAAAQVYSTARNVLPTWTTNYFLPSSSEPETPTSPIQETATSVETVDQSVLQDRFIAFDVLRGQDVIVKATDRGFSIFNVCDRAVELEELCGYTYADEVVSVKIIPTFDIESPPKAAILTKTGDSGIALSIIGLSTSLIIDHSITLPKHVITTSLITSQHYIALSTPKTLLVYSPELELIRTLPLPFPVVTGSARWLIYPVIRTNPSLPVSAILDTPPESRLVERVARGLTKEVVSWGRETGERIGEAIHTYLSGPQPTTPERKSPQLLQQQTIPTSSRRTTLVIHDIPTNAIMTQFQVPTKLGFISVSGTMLFCSAPRGDEFFVYSLSSIPQAIHLVATFSRGYTYSRVSQVIWRPDNGCLGVTSAHGTGHVFSLKRRGKEPARAVGKVKIEGGVKGFMFVRKQSAIRRRSSTARGDDVPDILTVANIHERLTSWKLASATKSTIGLLSSIFNPPTTDEEIQSIPIARPIADYTLPSAHSEISFPTLTSSPIIKAAFTNQKDSSLDCTPKAEVECSLTRGITGIRGIRIFEYTISTPYTDFGSSIPWTTKELDLGMPRGEVRYFEGSISSSGGGGRNIATPPSSEQDSPELQPDNSKKKRKNRNTNVPTETSGGIEKAISASLGTELDKARIITVPPTPPGSYSTPKLQTSEWMGEILDRGKSMVRNVTRQGSAVVGTKGSRDDEVCFEDGVEVLSLEDAPIIELDGSESSDGSGHGKVRGEVGTSFIEEQWLDQ